MAHLGNGPLHSAQENGATITSEQDTTCINHKAIDAAQGSTECAPKRINPQKAQP